MNFKEYRRIYPKLRLSWSLYKLWVSKDWIQVWNYLIGNEEVETEKQQLGSKVHDFIETTGCQLGFVL